MADDRVPLNLERDLHDEPFITTADHIRDGQDKSKMPWPESEERERQQEADQDDDSEDSRSSRRRSRSRRSRRRARRNRSERDGQVEEAEPEPEKVEQAALQKVVEQLKEKGMSDEFIQENMDKIRERVRDEIQ